MSARGRRRLDYKHVAGVILVYAFVVAMWAAIIFVASAAWVVLTR